MKKMYEHPQLLFIETESNLLLASPGDTLIDDDNILSYSDFI